MVSIEVFSDIIFGSPYGPRVNSSSNKKVSVVFPVAKGDRSVGLTSLPPTSSLVMKS